MSVNRRTLGGILETLVPLAIPFEKELELASRIQRMLIPENSSLPQNRNIHFTAFYHPHFSVGGDYYDCISLNSNEFGFCIADVCYFLSNMVA